MQVQMKAGDWLWANPDGNRFREKEEEKEKRCLYTRRAHGNYIVKKTFKHRH